jgi:hypothetical protein
MYFGGNLTVNVIGCSAAGDLTVAGTIGGTRTMTVGGTTYANATALPTPTINSADYLAAADAYYGTSTSFSGGTPPTPYYLIYVNGSLTLNSGSYGGKVIVFCTGDCQINGTMTYANSSAQLVVISMGNLKHGSAGSSPIGTYYVNGTVTVTKPFNFARGAVVAGSLTLSDVTSVTFDPYFKNNPSEMQNFKLPGYWP